MDKAIMDLNKIELFLEERFSKENNKYVIGGFKLNNGKDVKLYLDKVNIREEVIFELTDRSVVNVCLAIASYNFQPKKNESILKKLEKTISYIDNISEYIESIMNIANAGFETDFIDGSILEDRIKIIAKSKKGVSIGISGNFTEDKDYFEFETDSLIDGHWLF